MKWKKIEVFKCWVGKNKYVWQENYLFNYIINSNLLFIIFLDGSDT